MPVRVSVVGRIAVEHDGARVEGGALEGRRSRLLLAALATAGGTLSSAELARRLWADPPASWNAALRGAVAVLRTTLEPIGLGGQRLVVTTRTGWRIAEGTTTDLADATAGVVRAEAALAMAADADATADAGTALTQAELAVAASSGSVLPDDDGVWLDDLRGRNAAVRARALGAVADAALLLGRWTRAHEAAAELLETDPLDEAAHRRAIRALLASGDRAGAIRAYDRCRAALTEELGVDPAPETTALYLQVLQSGAGPTGSLPRPRDRFVGRLDEVRAACTALVDTRCVTLIGPGGIGKSRLALEVAHDRSIAADGGRFWVSLAEVADDALVPSAIATAVGAGGRAAPIAGTIAALAPAGRTLLVLDGCEQRRDAVAGLVPELLSAIPDLMVLCTSRTRLGGAAERRIAVRPIDAGPELLLTRLAEAPASRALDARERDLAGELCRRLGGVPLAIELAAAQLVSMSVGDLLDPLADATPDAVLETLVEQGYAALDPAEARLLKALGVVGGPIPLDLARAVAPAELTAPRVARVLGALAESGFVDIDRAGLRWRYGVDGHLRPFARERTSDAERLETLAALTTALDDVPPADATAPPAPFRTAIEAAVDAFRTVFDAAAHDLLDRDEGLRLAFRLHRHWASTGIAEGRYWFGRLLDGAPASRDAALARFAAGYLAYWAGDATDGLSQLRAAGDRLAASDPAFAVRALLYAGGLSDDADQADVAVDELRRAAALALPLGGALPATVELSFAAVLAERGDPAAGAAVRRAAALLPADVPAGHRDLFTANGALAAWRSGDIGLARELIAQSAALLAGPAGLSRALVSMATAGVALTDADPARAAECAAAAWADLRELGADRELPLAAALGARAAADLGDGDGARRHAHDAVDAAAAIGLAAPAALAVEAVLVARPDDPRIGRLAASSARIRARGNRPAPPGLQPSAAASGDPLEWQEALELARSVLG